MFNRFFLGVGLLLLTLTLFVPEAFAARALEINDLRHEMVDVDGRSVLRIEIGLNRAGASYTVQKDLRSRSI